MKAFKMNYTSEYLKLNFIPVFLLIVSAIFIISKLSTDRPLGKKPIKKSIHYQVICKHPIGHTLRYTVDQENWNNLANSRNSIWRFSDIEGNHVKLSGPCFTDDKVLKN